MWSRARRLSTQVGRQHIVKARCVGEAQLYIKGVEKLNEPGLTYARLNECLTERFSEKFPSQYYYTQLQQAKQQDSESPSQFLDRIRAIRAKTIKVETQLNRKFLRMRLNSDSCLPSSMA
jgi:ferritin-like protein